MTSGELPSMQQLLQQASQMQQRLMSAQEELARERVVGDAGGGLVSATVTGAGELVDFIAEARAAYGIGAPIAVGFSNGANIAAAVLLLHPEALQGAILIRAMVPLLERLAIS